MMSDQRVYRPYNVALWRRWSSVSRGRVTASPLLSDYDEVIYAPSSQQAVAWLMETHKLAWVGKVAVRLLPDGPIERWLSVDGDSLRHGEVTEEVREVWDNGRWVLPHEEPTVTESEVCL